MVKPSTPKTKMTSPTPSTHWIPGALAQPVPLDPQVLMARPAPPVLKVIPEPPAQKVTPVIPALQGRQGPPAQQDPLVLTEPLGLLGRRVHRE